MPQTNEKEFHTENVYSEQETGKLTMLLLCGYPAEAGPKDYTRSALLVNATIMVTDAVEFNAPGTVMFSYIKAGKGNCGQLRPAVKNGQL